jgi:serine/threonine protein phosphatase PrpC
MDPSQPKDLRGIPFSYAEDGVDVLRHPHHPNFIQYQAIANSSEAVFLEAENEFASVAAVTAFGRKPRKNGSHLNRSSQDGFIVQALPDGSLGLGVVDGHYDFGHIAAKFLLHRLETGWRRGESSLDILDSSSEALEQMINEMGRHYFYQFLEPGKKFLGIGACVSTARISKERQLVSEHLGDTRVTVIRPTGDSGSVLYESWDHNEAGDDQRKGGPAKVYSPREYSKLTRAITPTSLRELFSLPERDQEQPISLQKGDWVILSSDGGRALGVSNWLTAMSDGKGVKGFISHAHTQLEKNILTRGHADDYTLIALEIR